jgi:hypothetical protein
VRGIMDGSAPLPGAWKMRDDTDESPVRLLSGRRQRRPRVSFPFLEASPRCVDISPARLKLVVVFGRKPWSRAGSARWRRLQRRFSVGSIVRKTRLRGPMLHSSGARRCQRMIGRDAMHTMAGKSKTTPSQDCSSSTIDLLLMVRRQGGFFWSCCYLEVSSTG